MKPFEELSWATAPSNSWTSVELLTDRALEINKSPKEDGKRIQKDSQMKELVFLYGQ